MLFLLVSAAPDMGVAREHPQVYVTEPYLELHTGPGRGYPVFHVVAREESVEILFRRDEWFRVRTSHGVEGWAREGDMAKTVTADGSPVTFVEGDRAGYENHSFEAGLFAGQWGGSTLVSAFFSFPFNSQLAIEGSAGQYFGRFSSGVVGDIGLTHVIKPEWRLQPFVMIGAGILHTEPQAQIAQTDNRTEATAYVGAGLRYYLTRRFFVRAEYKSHMIFTKLNQNEAADEWKAGFAFFY